jgi:hypothetical protein
MSDQPTMPDPDEFPYGDERSRLYKAAGGGKRCLHLLFVPAEGERDRFLPFADIRLMEVRKDGTELQIEFSAVVVILTGRSLRPVAAAVAAHMCSRLEAFDPKQRDKPQDPTAPFISRISYWIHSGKEEAEKKGQEKETEAH